MRRRFLAVSHRDTRRRERHFVRLPGGVSVAGRIFISYRRADTAYPAGWLFDRLAEHFGPEQVFKDVDSIQLGEDFAEVIAAAVASCDVLLVLIGDQWLTATGEDGDRRLFDPKDYVRLEIESALARDVLVIPVLVDGARMPRPGELPPSLAGLTRRQALELSPSRFDSDTSQLLRVLDQTITGTQATQTSPVGGHRTAPGPGSRGRPSPGQTRPEPTRPELTRPGQQPPGPRRRLRTRTVVLIACAAVAAGTVAFIAIPGRGPAPPGTTHHPSLSKSAPSAAPAASSAVIVTDDFSTEKTGWVDDWHPAAGAYTGTGTYRLTVTGKYGQNEVARPAGATHGLSGVTPLNLSVSVDARKIAGAPQGYGYGIAFRSDSHGDVYAFVIEDHAVAIQKWVGGGGSVADSPAPVSTSAVHADAADRLQAVCATTDGGRAVHLELWLNGQKMIDFTDRDHPYTKGYLGLFVESISHAATTTGAEFGNFAAARL